MNVFRRLLGIRDSASCVSEYFDAPYYTLQKGCGGHYSCRRRLHKEKISNVMAYCMKMVHCKKCRPRTEVTYLKFHVQAVITRIYLFRRRRSPGFCCHILSVSNFRSIISGNSALGPTACDTSNFPTFVRRRAVVYAPVPNASPRSSTSDLI